MCITLRKQWQILQYLKSDMGSPPFPSLKQEQPCIPSQKRICHNIFMVWECLETLQICYQC